MSKSPSPALLLSSILVMASFGCQTKGPVEAAATWPEQGCHLPTGLTAPHRVATLDAVCDPPISWHAEPLKQNERHTHQVWISPSGLTAYGVIEMKLPWPVGPDLALWGFLNSMKKSEGQADLVSKQTDSSLPGLRFVADGGRYRLRVNLTVKTWRAWAVYAGTVRDQRAAADELDLAERARDLTRVDVGATDAIAEN